MEGLADEDLKKNIAAYVECQRQIASLRKRRDTLSFELRRVMDQLYEIEAKAQTLKVLVNRT
jgi:hypothetical protein